MTTHPLTIRINAHHPNHPLFNNNGTWFEHFTHGPSRVTAERVRQSLRTTSLDEARRRRDRILGLGTAENTSTPTGRI